MADSPLNPKQFLLQSTLDDRFDGNEYTWEEAKAAQVKDPFTKIRRRDEVEQERR